MLVSQYSSPSSSAVLGSGEMFTSIAPTYDIVNRIISLNSRDMSWRSALVSSYEIVKGVPDGGVALDLACGTGDTTFMIAEKFPNMKAIGLDPSRGMLDIAGAKQRERGQRDGNIKRISFIEGSATSFPPNMPALDFVTMSFGVRNVPMEDWEGLKCEVHGALNEGGVFAILEVSDPRKSDDNRSSVSSLVLAHLAAVFIEYIVPFIGGVISGGRFFEYNHLQSSIKRFPSPSEFAHFFSQGECGFKPVSREAFNFGSVHLFVFEKR